MVVKQESHWSQLSERLSYIDGWEPGQIRHQGGAQLLLKASFEE